MPTHPYPPRASQCHPRGTVEKEVAVFQVVAAAVAGTDQAAILMPHLTVLTAITVKTTVVPLLTQKALSRPQRRRPKPLQKQRLVSSTPTVPASW